MVAGMKDRQITEQHACRIGQQDNLNTPDGRAKQLISRGEVAESAQTSLKAAGINKEQV